MVVPDVDRQEVLLVELAAEQEPMEPLVVAPEVHDQAALVELAAEQEGLRYSFRKRNPAQLAPYTADLIRYKRALRFNPDAIVKMKHIEMQLELERQQQQHHHRTREEKAKRPKPYPMSKPRHESSSRRSPSADHHTFDPEVY